ncbi:MULTISPECIES: carboxymuconolactone decarboxylase family protein [unclassified Streptomyces]|uniref:carboxymuconolactone decarboxylase family protein n=1 Tax=unclassified Streptomyces TaxID=2593676 RepID=UPI002E0FD47B|nr:MULTISPECIES: carboxymuconolactone decarboxylase family protein [unclassified Streptomyces]
MAGLLSRATGNRPVPRTTIDLVQLRAAQIVGNTDLTVMHSTLLRKAGASEERMTAAASRRHTAPPSGSRWSWSRRCCLLPFAAGPGPGSGSVTRAYGRVAEHYSEKALATLTVAGTRRLAAPAAYRSAGARS